MDTARFLLYWGFHKLYVHENGKNIILVDAIVKAIEAGDKFEPIEVLKLPRAYGDMSFCLNQDGSGGHHRALGHYIAGKPLPCIWLREHRRLNFSLLPIGKIELFDHRELPIGLDTYCTNIFNRKSREYPRLDWDEWGLKRQTR